MANLDEARRCLARANRILAHEGVLDAFGHVSARHPTDPDRYLLSRSLAPAVVRPEDILEFNLESELQSVSSEPLYAERVIHGAIYQLRPDVKAICHHHSASVMPFCITDRKLFPISQLGAVTGHTIPIWDSRDDFGDTELLVIKAQEGLSLAHALGQHWLVLMRRHGATCVGRSLQEMTFRTIHSTANAEHLLRAMSLGIVEGLSRGEIDLASEIRQMAIDRSWGYWTLRCP